MKRWSLWIAVLVLSAAAAACGGGGGGDAGAAKFLAALQGTWTTGCVAASSGTGYTKATQVIDGSQVSAAVAWYHDAADSSCQGDHFDTEVAGTLAVGGAVSATMGSDTVTAREVDATTQDGTHYTILYVDTTSTPQRLYSGDVNADPAKDGASPSRRPTVLGLAYAEKQ